jgi:hypothetical protein
MVIGTLDAPPPQRADEVGIETRRKIGKAGWPGRQALPVGDAPCQLPIVLDLFENPLQIQHALSPESGNPEGL